MLRASRPDLPVVSMSGYTPGAEAHAAGTRPGDDFLAKPFPLDALAATIRRRLARPIG